MKLHRGVFPYKPTLTHETLRASTRHSKTTYKGSKGKGGVKGVVWGHTKQTECLSYCLELITAAKL